MAWFKRTRKAASKMTDLEGIKRQQRFLHGLFTTLFKVDKVKDPCEFEDLASRGITEKKIQTALTKFVWLYRFFSIFATVLLIYALTLLYKGHFPGAIVAIAMSLLFYVHAFKYHFWAYQIRVKKLGCTVGEWFNYLTGKRG